MTTYVKKQSTLTAIIVALIASFAIGSICLVSSAFADNSDNTDAQTCTATAKITATFDSDGNITIPDTELKNDTDYVVTVKSITTSSDTYSIIKDWTNDFTEGTTIDPGESLTIKWSTTSKVPTGFDGTTEIKIGTITYEYSYEIPEISGKVEIEGTPAVGETLTAKVSDLPDGLKESNLVYAWSVVNDDGSLTPIEGATSKTYTVADEYAGKQLTVVVTDVTGHYTGSLTAEPVTIKSVLTGSVAIKVNDEVVTTAELNTELTATVSDLPAGVQEADLVYAWYVVDESGTATPIEGATAQTFTPSDSSYIGKTVTVKVTAKDYSGALEPEQGVEITAVKIAFVVLSGDDTAGYDMYFCKRETVPEVGETITIDDTSVTAAAVYSKLDDAALPEGSVSHDIETAVYSLDGSGNPNTPWAEKRAKINTATVVDTGIKPISTACWFAGGSKLASVAGIDKLDTSETTDMSYMFYGNYGITDLDLDKLDTQSVMNMEGMFMNCTHLKKGSFEKVSNFKTSNVENMSGMFYSCGTYYKYEETANLDLSGWDTSNVTDMSWLFVGCGKLASVDVSTWDTSKVTTMKYMFRDCDVLGKELNLESFDTSKVTNMYGMFQSSNGTNLETIILGQKWDTSEVTDMAQMFYRCSKLTLDCSSWNVDKVTSYSDFKSSASGVTSPNWKS